MRNTSITQRELLSKIRTHLKKSLIIKLVNVVIEEIVDKIKLDLTGLNSFMYATAFVLQRRLGVKPKRNSRSTRAKLCRTENRYFEGLSKMNEK